MQKKRIEKETQFSFISFSSNHCKSTISPNGKDKLESDPRLLPGMRTSTKYNVETVFFWSNKNLKQKPKTDDQQSWKG